MGIVMSGGSVFLTDEDRALLLKVSSLLEGIVETLEILRDEDTVESIRRAEEDMRAGRVRDYDDFFEELKHWRNMALGRDRCCG